MAMMRALCHAAPAQVFAVAGRGAARAVRNLRVAKGIDLVDSPRHATVLLIAGQIPDGWHGEVARLHDQLPHPRAVVRWGVVVQGTERSTFASVLSDADATPVVQQVQRELLEGTRASSPPLGPAQAPVEWQGVGPHGQGGEGMMGGHPYGRPMAMTGPDLRDGLQLDLLKATLGPFLASWWPPGLILDVALQGDVLAQVAVADARPFARRLDGAAVDIDPGPPTATEIVTDMLVAVGHPVLARRWLLADTAGRRRLAGRVRWTFSGFSGTRGHNADDGHDLPSLAARWVSAATDRDDLPERPLAGVIAVPRLPQLLTGLTWREAAVTIAGLGLDLSHPDAAAEPTPTDTVSATALRARP
ncbi:MAG: hypothetical protein ACR2HR_18030 [Euzebya sp.]